MGSIIQSVVDTLNAAPVNMRLQIAGLRLLALWQNLEDKRIDTAMKEAKAKDAFKNAIDNLSKAGFVHAASWIDSIAGCAFEEKGKGKKKTTKSAEDLKSAGVPT